MARAIDWTHYDQLKAQGLGDREIARQWEIPWSTFHREKQKRYTQDHSGTPEHTVVIPAIRSTRAHHVFPRNGPLRYTRAHPPSSPPSYTLVYQCRMTSLCACCPSCLTSK